ncbi:MAG TPA: tRNA lysidine(34) synthetase TilS [Allosphingosinicella sp.]|jgi:tRNA(Ile)-lysidine synthase
MDSLPRSSAQAERFRSALERLAGPRVQRLGVAVSGGPDSLALLLLATAGYPGRVHAATVDHHLRPESAEEARFVAGLCARLDVPHSVLPVEVACGGQGMQGEARRARYDALARWAAEQGISTVCTAHHADDQAETVLMRLQRGSGAAGLAGVRPVRKVGDLLVARPLLDWSRAQLAALVEEAGLTAIADPSNQDSRFDRVRMRSFLAANPQFEARRLARSAASLGEANQALEWAADLLEAERCAPLDGEWRIDATDLPRELARRLLARALAAIQRDNGLQACSAPDLEGLLRTLEAGGTGTLAGVMASASGSAWRVRQAPPRRRA